MHVYWMKTKWYFNTYKLNLVNTKWVNDFESIKYKTNQVFVDRLIQLNTLSEEIYSYQRIVIMSRICCLSYQPHCCFNLTCLLAWVRNFQLQQIHMNISKA